MAARTPTWSPSNAPPAANATPSSCALVSESETYPKPPRFRAGGYIAKVPLDPWGRPYHYASEEKLRTEPIEYSLFTLGKDGKEGGTGDDADICSLHVKYLRHILED